MRKRGFLFVALVAGTAGGKLLELALKATIHRRRPSETAELLSGDTFSFPSGHTLHAFAFATLLSALHPALAPLLWGFAALVGLSRVVLGLHFPSDVMAGALLGITTAGLVLQAA